MYWYCCELNILDILFIQYLYLDNFCNILFGISFIIVEWVIQQAKDCPFIKGVVAGIDLTSPKASC